MNICMKDATRWATGSAAGIVERLSDLRGREQAVRRRQARLHGPQNCR